eukprot:TRINITY_DN10821_c0_g1_i4.p1 TRINITY_DN10821_c0_g1~~TRINITY_DN10821_c0_g1_i4.p1  ORF type:complete len:446 (+),score=105.06 TRINITY_DN10821_c0_g1_i4:110-1339(+)
MAIGLDNITTITQCVEASDPSVAVRFRIAEGLSKAGGALTKSLLQMEVLLLLGAWFPLATMSDFCMVAAVAMFTDFNFQVIIYVSVLSLDTRRLELSDFLVPHKQPKQKPFFSSLLHYFLPSSPSPDARWQSSDTTAEEGQQFVSNTLKSVKQSGTGRVIVVNNLLILMGMIATVILTLLRGASLSQAPSAVEATVQADWYQTYQGLQRHGEQALIVFPPPLTFHLADKSPRSIVYSLLDWVRLDLIRLESAFEYLFTGSGLTFFLAFVGAWFLLYQLTLIVRRRLFGLRENIDALAPLSLLALTPATLKGHGQSIECVAGCEQSKRGVTTTMDGHVRVWDLEDHRLLAALKLRLQPMRSQSLSPAAPERSTIGSNTGSVVRLDTGRASPDSDVASRVSPDVTQSPLNQ